MTSTVDTDDHMTLQHQVCFSLAVASREVVSLYRPLLQPLGLTHPQYLVMVTLWGAGEPVSAKELSRLLNLEPPTLSPLLKRLQSAGLIERQRDPADERSLIVSLTEQGQALRVEAAGVPPALFIKLGMSMEKIETLRNVLTELIVHAKLQNDGPDGDSEATELTR